MRIKSSASLKPLNLATDIIGLSMITCTAVIDNMLYIEMLVLTIIGFGLIKLDIE
ncbi:hypothetical protein C672_3652 [[Clostridium] bifermentans ATCC 638]|uniref:Uncharacterized protein n=1 Tax=Paraclostridium bifermentans ATCC 638 = DSM 14991 TaxID=1233171 RepID=T4VE38_PARBF|nr:hypothetical protein [Paraclostridium bifermentans]EQK39753.1 hypothetical protein C672_3652 [[Clostridium] bifermentans ATCC 638] [Paraclostridium bifermentans ATCC 638 = DSM 14991]